LILSMRLTIKGHLEHKEKIKAKAEDLLAKMHSKKLRKKVYVVNVKRYLKDYPTNKEKRFEGYSNIAAAIKATRYNGIEFFEGMPREVYKTPNGELTFKSNDNKEEFLAYPVGIVPYEWIEYVDPDGDEYSYFPLFFCRFKKVINWKFWLKGVPLMWPYKKITYYKKRAEYKETDHPLDAEYELINENIKNG
jgi:hypothetical protein